MFSRWGAFVYRFRRPIVLIAIVAALASTTLASQASSALSAGGWLDANSESAAVASRLDAEFGAGKSSIIVLFRSDTPGADATSVKQGLSDTALALPVIRTEIALDVIHDGADPGVARCLSGRIVQEYSVDDLIAADPAQFQTDEFFQQVSGFAQECGGG